MENTKREFIKYEKNVIMLSEEKREFSVRDNVQIRGSLKIETGNNKGAMSLSIKNLRFFERSRYIYKLILFGERREKTIHAVIGTLIVNRSGSAENYFRFNPSNVDGKGSSLNEFSMAIVAAVSMKDNKEPLHPVLRGYLYGKPEKQSADDECKAEDETEQTQKQRREYEQKQEECHEIQNKCDNHENCQQPKRTYNRYYNDYLKSACGRMEKACEVYDTIVPFSEDKTNAVWKRMSNVNNLPIISNGAVKCAARYRHYLFGSDEKFYFFGIPGRYIKEEHPDGGCSGFVFWQPIRGAENLGAEKEDCPQEVRMTAYGYWIAAIERETGDIVDPVCQTAAIDPAP